MNRSTRLDFAELIHANLTHQPTTYLSALFELYSPKARDYSPVWARQIIRDLPPDTSVLGPSFFLVHYRSTKFSSLNMASYRHAQYRCRRDCSVRGVGVSYLNILHESSVIRSVSRYLENAGWQILESNEVAQHGDDIVARRKGLEIRIEAKGAGSEQSHTARFGQQFSRRQVRSHVAVAFCRAARMRSDGTITGMTLPNNADHREMAAAIDGALIELGIIVIWVAEDGSVTQSIRFEEFQRYE